MSKHYERCGLFTTAGGPCVRIAAHPDACLTAEQQRMFLLPGEAPREKQKVVADEASKARVARMRFLALTSSMPPEAILSELARLVLEHFGREG